MNRPLGVDELGAESSAAGSVDLSARHAFGSAVGLLRRRWRIVLGFPLLVSVLTGGVSLLIPPRFTANALFVPEASSETDIPAGLVGLAGQFGVSLGSGASLSPQFYVSIMQTRVLLERVLLSRYGDPRPSARPADSVTLFEMLKVSGKSPADSLENAVKVLRKRINVSVDGRTDIVHLAVEAPYPSLAADAANRFIALVDDFNTDNRRSRAGERRQFLKGRVAAAEQTVLEAEDALQAFYERNRSWQQSPQLVFEEGRLGRRVELQEQVLLRLMQEAETAALEEVNDTPVITLVEAAIPPARRSWPRRTMLVLLSLGLSAISVITWVLAAEDVKGWSDPKYRQGTPTPV